MHLAVGQLFHLRDRIAVLHIDDVGGAELGRKLQLHRIVVDGDDAPDANDRRTIDRRHANAAAADHHHRFAGPTLAVLKIAPAPVMTPQPISAGRSSGISCRIFTKAFSCTSIRSAKDDELVDRPRHVPGHARRHAGRQLDLGVGADPGGSGTRQR
jgi:hypothetical protein